MLMIMATRYNNSYDEAYVDDDRCLGKVENKLIQFKSVYGIARLTIQPAIDARTRQIKGVRMISDDEKRRLVYWVDNNTTRTIESGFTLDLNNCIDATDWMWIKYSKGIAMSQEEAMSDDHCMFFVWDEDKEASKNLTRFDLMRKALNYISDTPDSELSQKARLLGEKWEGLTPSRIRTLLNDQASHVSLQKIQEIIDIYEDSDADDKLFLYKLIDKGIVKLINNVYKYGDITMGIGENQAVVFLQDPDYKHIREELLRTCYPEFFKNGQIKENLVNPTSGLKAAKTDTAVAEKKTSTKGGTKKK